jgi:hypothetical protein
MKYLVKARQALCLLGRLYVAGAWLTIAITCTVYGTVRGRGWYDLVAAVIVLGCGSGVLAPLYLLVRKLGRGT